MSGFLSTGAGSGSSGINVDGQRISTAEATSSASYTNLATNGPTSTVTVGASGKLLITISAAISRVVGSGSSGFASFSLSGSNTISANDQNSIESSPQANGSPQSVSTSVLLSSLSPGETSVTMKYRTSDAGSTFQFKNRSLTVIPI